MDASLRASDADRERVVTALGRHLSDGRLTLVEFEDRVGQAYAARTFGDLAPLTADLPGPGPFDRRAPGVGDLARATDRRPERRRTERGELAAAPGPGFGLLLPALICVAIWLASWVSSGGDRPAFWPIWVIAPCLVIATARCLSGRRG